MRGIDRAKVGATPKDVVWDATRRSSGATGATRRAEYPPPLLLVHEPGQPSYILDLRPAAARRVPAGQGLDVYMLDWGIPDELDADNTSRPTSTSTCRGRSTAVLRESDCDEITIFGYCFGGVLALLYAAATTRRSATCS